MTYIIRFPVGDWSDDGHGKCDYFEVRSNYPVQQLREIHFKAPDVVGFEIGNMCREDSQLSTDVFGKLIAIGFDLSQYTETEECYMDSEGIIDIWLAILRHIDPSVELERIKSEAEDINFYGFDKKKRHLAAPGYGVFY